PLYAQSPAEKQKKRLATSSSQFDQSLSRVNYGAGWKKHLQTDDVKRLASQSEEYKATDKEKLIEIQRRFDEIAGDEQFNKIVRLDGFDETGKMLRGLIEAIKAERQEAEFANVLKTVRLSSNPTNVERNVVATLKEIAKIKSACAAEGRAKVKAAMSKKILARAGADDRKVLARQASQADEVLKLATKSHNRSMLAAETNLYRVLRLIRAGKQYQRGDETVFVLPLEDTAWVLPLDDPESVQVLPPEPRVMSPETGVLPPEPGVLPLEPGVLPPKPGVLPPEPAILPPEDQKPEEPVQVLPLEDGDSEDSPQVLPLEDSDKKDSAEDKTPETKVLAPED
ncbi:MAG: hypothetical protein N2C12_10385, partial [Planctomycetales bacterium]